MFKKELDCILKRLIIMPRTSANIHITYITGLKYLANAGTCVRTVETMVMQLTNVSKNVLFLLSVNYIPHQLSKTQYIIHHIS